MSIHNKFKRSYYAIVFRKRTSKLLFEHDKAVDFDLYKTNWKIWYADPIVFKHKDKEWLFAEKMDMLRHKGSIAVAEIGANGIGDFKEVLNEDFHLSYPMVFNKDGNIYMIPESAKEQKVYLYKCMRFPYQWKRINVILQGGYFADTNVVNNNNHWYLITGKMDPNNGARTKLQIYKADEIEKGHIEILYTDKCFEYSYESRGAGNILNINNMIIRPTQVGDSQHYGKRINFCHLDIGDKYVEELICSFGCERIKLQEEMKLTGTHTYALSDDYEIIDIQYSRFVHPAVLIRTITSKVKARIIS